MANYSFVSDGLVLALLVVLLMMLVCVLSPKKEPLTASPKAKRIAAEASKVFGEHGGRPPYQLYKRKVTDADPVQFHEVRELFRSGQLSPEQVEELLV